VVLMRYRSSFPFHLLLAVPLLVAHLGAMAASFDCAKARYPMEKLICSDSKLSTMDEHLNAAFKDAVLRSNAKPLMTKWQRDWLKSYDVTQCKDAKCLSTEFSKRIDLLQNVAVSSDSAAQWNGNFTKYYNGKPDKDSANLFLIGMSGGKIYVNGSALWFGANADNGQIHTGEIIGIGQLKSERAIFDFDGCSATMVLKISGVKVEEESGCGGVNVSFVGEYKRN